MDHRIRLREAIALAKQYKKIRIKELAQKLFPDSSPDSAYIRFNGLVTGRIRSITKQSVEILCRELNTTPGFLFGMTKKQCMCCEKTIEAKEGLFMCRSCSGY